VFMHHGHDGHSSHDTEQHSGGDER
jgi:hypothetical protein